MPIIKTPVHRGTKRTPWQRRDNREKNTKDKDMSIKGVFRYKSEDWEKEHDMAVTLRFLWNPFMPVFFCNFKLRAWMVGITIKNDGNNAY